MKFNEKYALAILTVLGIQPVLGVNFANAICDNEIRVYCNEVLKLNYGAEEKLCDGRKDEEINDLVEVFKDGRKSYPSDQAYINYQLVEVLEPSYKNLMVVNKPMGRARNNFQLCVLNHTLGNSNTSSSGKPSSSGSSSNANSNSTNKQSSSSSNGASTNQQSQQNSSPEEIERSNVKNYTAHQTAAYQDKYKGRGKKHNIDAEASRCISVKGRKVLNNCDYPVEAVFCAINPDPDSKHAFEMANGFDCARNSKGMWGISARSPLMGVFTAERVTVFACKKPSLPGAEYDHQKQTLVGRCSEY